MSFFYYTLLIYLRIYFEFKMIFIIFLQNIYRKKFACPLSSIQWELMYIVNIK